MALVYINGFDYLGTASDFSAAFTDRSGTWYAGSGAARFGGRGAYFGSARANYWLRQGGFDSAATWTAGIALYVTSEGDGGGPQGSLLGLLDGTTTQVIVQLNPSTHELRVLRGSTLLATSVSTLAYSTWYYIELSATIHNTTGAYEVRVNGDTWLGASGVNTRNSANNYANGIVIGPGWGVDTQIRRNWYLDDLYVRDDGTFLDNCRVVALRPDGAGVASDWTPTGESNGWQTVDEEAPDGESTYVATNTDGHRDSYTLTDLDSGYDVLGVQPVYLARNVDAGPSVFTPQIYRGGTTHDGDGRSLSASYRYERQMWETDPIAVDTWTVSSVNGLEAGMKATT